MDWAVYLRYEGMEVWNWLFTEGIQVWKVWTGLYTQGMKVWTV
jgi:hypothetical protein